MGVGGSCCGLGGADFLGRDMGGMGEDGGKGSLMVGTVCSDDEGWVVHSQQVVDGLSS